MALTREQAGTLSHAELVGLVVELTRQVAERDAAIAALRTLVATLEARLRDLERQLKDREQHDPTQRMPGLKPAATPRRRQAGPPKQRTHGFSRRVSTAPTEVVTHAAPVCPHCATPLGERDNGRERWRKEVLDLPPLDPARSIQHVYLERRCPNPACGRRVAPPRASAAELGVPGVRQRLGVELVARIALLRAELRLPEAVIAWYLAAVHQLELSEGAIVGALHRVAAAGRGFRDQVQAAIRGSPWVQADETGLRQDGVNGYLWSFGTATERLYVHGGRAKEMVDEVLGTGPEPALDAFTGVLSTDFYAAYDHYAGPHQRCWAHLLRDIHAVRLQHPQDAVLQQWAEDVQGVYTEAKRLQVAPLSPAQREAAQRSCEADLLAVCRPFLALPADVNADVNADADPNIDANANARPDQPPGSEPMALAPAQRPRKKRKQPLAGEVPQAVLCRRIQKYLPELFTFVADPRVDSTNNGAERDIRPVVIQRKISGGTRSAQGTRTFCTLATLFGTWRARNRDPLVACRQLLLAHAAAAV